MQEGDEVLMPRFQTLKERFMMKNNLPNLRVGISAKNGSDFSHSNDLLIPLSPKIIIDEEIQSKAERKLKKKATKVSKLAPEDDQNSADDPLLPKFVPSPFEERKRFLKESIEQLRMKLQDHRVDGAENKAGEPILESSLKSSPVVEVQVDRTSADTSNCEMNTARKNKLALQKLKKRSIFNKVDRARSMIFASVLQRQGVDIRPTMTAIEREAVSAIKADDCIALLNAQVRNLRALMLYFTMDTDTDQYSSGGDCMTVEDMHYFLDRTARNNTSRDGQRDPLASSSSSSSSSSAASALTDTAAEGGGEEAAAAEVGCAEIFMAIASAVNVTLSAQIHKLNVSCSQMQATIQDRDNSLRSMKLLLDENVEQLSDVYVRLEQMNQRRCELEESLSYHRGMAERVVELEARLQQAEQHKKAAEAELRLEINRNRGYQSEAGRIARLVEQHSSVDSDELPDSDWYDEILVSESRFLTSSRTVHLTAQSAGAHSGLGDARTGLTGRLCQSVRSLSGPVSRGDPSCRLSRQEVSQLVAAHASQLSELTVSDWASLFSGPVSSHKGETGGLNFTELASISADLEAVLGKLKTTKEEMTRRQSQMIAKCADEALAGAASSSSLCCICLDAPKSILVLPCKHFCVCANCARGGEGAGAGAGRSLRQCPVCRAAVQDFMHVYS